MTLPILQLCSYNCFVIKTNTQSLKKSRILFRKVHVHFSLRDQSFSGEKQAFFVNKFSKAFWMSFAKHDVA